VSTDTTNVSGLSGRYATALYDLAESQGVLDQVADDLRSIAEMIDGSDDFERMIRSPIVSRRQQSKAILAVLDKTGISGIARSFVGVAATNRRLFALPDIITDYLAILAGKRGEVMAQVTSAQALTNVQQAELTKALNEAIGQPGGDKVTIKSTVDPDLLGGLVVKLGSRMVDSSLRTKLQHLQLAMRGAG
jgi:F-type H+-transporting ATPase subunit delta